MQCRTCGANLYNRAQEVCMTATTQGFTVQPDCPPDTFCTAWESIEAHPEAQELCELECRDCTTTLTPEQARELRRLMAH